MTAIDFSAFVDELATVSGETILPFFRTSLGIHDKGRGGRFDPVTAADRAAEAAMRTLIHGAFPAHGIVGEELGVERPDAEYVWVLDPIDGTKSFIAGMPAWGTLIALTRVDRALTVRSCAEISDAVLFTTSPLSMTHEERGAFGRVEAAVRLSRYGGDCYAYCMLAAGHVDLVIETGLEAYDVVALVPIIVGAGGVITTWEGGPARHGGRIIAAGDRRVHEAAITLLRG
jgi:myo-inositol-1(or 4)-monophosphatase